MLHSQWSISSCRKLRYWSIASIHTVNIYINFIDDQRILQAGWMRRFWTRFFSRYGVAQENRELQYISFWVTSRKKWWQNSIKNKTTPSWKILFCSFLLFLYFYCCAEYQKKLMNRFQEKLVTEIQIDGHMDAQMVRLHEFIGPPLPGVQ